MEVSITLNNRDSEASTDKTELRLSKRIYYYIKPFLPRKLQIMLRSRYARIIQQQYKQIWPINPKAGTPPKHWSGWPEQKKFALILTHDMESVRGVERCKQLMELEEKFGFRSCIFFVADKYPLSSKLRDDLHRRGYEVGIHGLKHDGRLYASKGEFQKRAVLINRYLQEWNSVGFRSPCMYHNLEWLLDLKTKYDCSTFDTDPFEPQSDGVDTIFPFWVPGDKNRHGYVELPYTLAQDFTLFVLLKERTIEIWKKKLDWIVEQGGMVLLNTHADYMAFNGNRPGCDEYPAGYYEEFLNYIQKRYEGRYWHVLPRDMAHFLSEEQLKHNKAMKL